MKNTVLFALILIIANCVQAQKFATRNGLTAFFSKTALEDIKAENKQTYAVIDATDKKMAFVLLVKGFIFSKQLMQDHFNENYIESDRYPKASFSGNYTGDINLAKNGIYPLMVKGMLSLHGVIKSIELPATVEVKDGVLLGKADLDIKPSDYAISIPSIVREKIAPLIKVRLSVECTELK